MSLHPERQSNGERQFNGKRLARRVAGPLLALAFAVTGCRPGETLPTPVVPPGDIPRVAKLWTPASIEEALPLTGSIPPDLEQVEMSLKDRAWEEKGIKDLYSVLKENINPAFQNPALMEPLGQDLSLLSDVELIGLQIGLRHAGKWRKIQGDGDHIDWGNISLRPEQGLVLGVRNDSQRLPNGNGSFGELHRSSIRVNLNRSFVPELREFVNDVDGGLKPGTLEEVAAILFHLPADFQWATTPSYAGAARGIQGSGTLPTGKKVEVRVDISGYAELTVTKPPSTS